MHILPPRSIFLKLAKFRGVNNKMENSLPIWSVYAWYNESKQFSNYLRSVRSTSPMHKPIKSVKKFSILLFTPPEFGQIEGEIERGGKICMI